MAKLTITSKPFKRGEFKGSPGAADYQALGEFISACSLLEVTMHLVIRRWLDIDEEIARALIGEPRSGELIDLLRFGFERQNEVPRTNELRKAIESLYDRAGFINSVRSVVAHKPCLTDGVEMMFHNLLTTRSASKAFTYTCSAGELHNCAEHTLSVSLALRQVTTIAIEYPTNYVQRCNELIASVDRLGLPADPRKRNQRTAK